MAMILKKQDLEAFLNATGRVTYLPVEKNNTSYFERAEAGGVRVTDFVFNNQNTIMPAKEIPFPQTETLFTYQKKSDGTFAITPNYPKKEQTLIFGIRPCDAAGIGCIDGVFGGEIQDVYYTTRRNSTVLVGLACTNPRYSCFCTSVGLSPSSTKNLDVLMTDLGDTLYVETITDKGAALIETVKRANATLISDANDADKEKARAVHAAAAEKIALKLDADGSAEKLEKLFEDGYWEQAAKACLSCGICTYQCPSCHCFDVNDEGTMKSGRRVRTWDSCQFPFYTMHTSGHNPRADKRARVRNRVLHKYQYYPQKHEGNLMCVGCGRCIEQCPVNIDIAAIIREMMTHG